MHRFFLPAILLAALVPAPVLAQAEPPPVEQALWCASALIIAGESTGREDTELGKRGDALLAKTQMRLLEQGLGDDQIKSMTEAAQGEARAQLLSRTAEPHYSYEDCLSLEERDQ